MNKSILVDTEQYIDSTIQQIQQQLDVIDINLQPLIQQFNTVTYNQYTVYEQSQLLLCIIYTLNTLLYMDQRLHGAVSTQHITKQITQKIGTFMKLLHSIQIQS